MLKIWEAKKREVDIYVKINKQATYGDFRTKTNKKILDNNIIIYILAKGRGWSPCLHNRLIDVVCEAVVRELDGPREIVALLFKFGALCNDKIVYCSHRELFPEIL